MFNWLFPKKKNRHGWAVNPNPPKLRALGFGALKEAVVFDLETTGFSAENDRIVSIFAIKGDLQELSKGGNVEFVTLSAILNPEIPIPRQASKIHGIFDKDVINKEKFADIAGKVAGFFEEYPVISHNSDFDVPFLVNSMRRSGYKDFECKQVFCTMKAAAKLIGGDHATRGQVSLAKACENFGIKLEREKHHEAHNDALAALRLASVIGAIERSKAI